MQLLINAQVQNGFGFFAKAYTRGTASGTITKLNDAVASLVGGLRVHAIALHEREACKVVWRKLVFVGHLQNLVKDILLFVAWNKASGHSAV